VPVRGWGKRETTIGSRVNHEVSWVYVLYSNFLNFHLHGYILARDNIIPITSTGGPKRGFVVRPTPPEASILPDSKSAADTTMRASWFISVIPFVFLAAPKIECKYMSGRPYWVPRADGHPRMLFEIAVGNADQHVRESAESMESAVSVPIPGACVRL
jgi:hypothetical protein